MLNWRDLRNPRSGGAEVLTEGILRELAAAGHDITLFTAQFIDPATGRDAAGEETRADARGSYNIIRRGGQATVRAWAFWYWITRGRRAGYDVVVDQFHGLPFYTALYISNRPAIGNRPARRRIAFIHEVGGEIWFAMFKFPLAQIGFAAERLALKMYRHTPFITVSDSTRADLIAIGIPARNISIIPEAINEPPEHFAEQDRTTSKNGQANTQNAAQAPAAIFVGRLVPMKRVEEFLTACGLAQKVVPGLETWVVGTGEPRYEATLKERAERLGLRATFFGRVSEEKKYELLSRAKVFASASIKEGFGLVILEAGLVGTPSVVYDVAGFRDAVIPNETGYVCHAGTPRELANAMSLLLLDKKVYERMSGNAREYARQFTFKRAAGEMERVMMNA